MWALQHNDCMASNSLGCHHMPGEISQYEFHCSKGLISAHKMNPQTDVQVLRLQPGVTASNI
jgi:hypothetical protein